ncbi:FAD-binding oxidoreductase [Patescibacteria group bacterium]|nr:FAD-binding oxidoreductase [Patescibacteria group bacterium]
MNTQLKSYQYDMVLSELIDIVGKDDLTIATPDKFVYAVDHYWVPEMWLDRGEQPVLPDFIVHPETPEEVSRIMILANTYRIPITPWGGGSGSQGGSLPVYGGIILDVKKLNKIIDIDTHSLTITAQAGINGEHLEWAANQKGITVGHYPASQRASTLGGWLAARGSGTLSAKYGKAEDMVLSLQVVLPTGEIIRTLPTPNHATGPGLMQFIVGSEGTLGVITEATMRADPIPEERRFRSFLFSNLADGLEAGRRIMTARIRPMVIRVYDEESTVKQVKRVLDLTATGTYMVVGFDGFKEFVDLEEKKVMEICLTMGGKDLGNEAGWRWWNHRYDFYFPPRMKSLPRMFGTTDTVSTYRNIEKIYYAKKEIIETKYRKWNAYYQAHFSHWYPWGVMVYDEFFIDKPPQDPHEALLLHNQIWADLVRASIANGGVLNEHHGTGMKLGWLMREQYGPAFSTLQSIKDAIDPNGIMNPGKLGFALKG